MDLTGADTAQDEDPYVQPTALPGTPGVALPTAPPQMGPVTESGLLGNPGAPEAPPTPENEVPEGQPVPVPGAPVVPQLGVTLPPGARTAGTSITTHIPTPADMADRAALAANADQQKTTAEKETALKVKQAGIESAGADAQLANHTAFQKIREQAIGEAEKELKQKRADHQKAFDDYASKTEITSYWQNKSTLSRVLAGIATFLGGLGASATGGRNSGADIIEAAVKQDFDEQRARIERRRSIVDMAKGNLVAAEQAKQDALKALDIKEAAANAAISARMTAEAKRLGVPLAQVEGDKSVQRIDQNVLTNREKVDAQDRSQVVQTAAAKVAKATGSGGGTDQEALVRKMVREGASGEDIVRATGGMNSKARDKAMASEIGLQRERKGESTVVETEMREALKPVTGKGGIRESQQHLEGSIRKLEGNINDPVEWTNAIDAAIRSNTGKAAIKQQYDLYRSHAGGAAQKFEDWFQGVRDGNLGETAKKNFMGSFRSSLSELQHEGGEAERNFRENYIVDPRITSNPTARAAFEAMHKGTFGTMHGGESIGRAGVPAPGAAAFSKASPATASTPGDRARAIVNDKSKRSLYSQAEWANLVQASRGK